MPCLTYRLAMVAVFGGVFALMSVNVVMGLPAGRAWSVAQEVTWPRLNQLGGTYLYSDSNGVPVFVVGVHWDTASTYSRDFARFHWRDSLWVDPLFAGLRIQVGPVPFVSLTPSRKFSYLTGQPPISTAWIAVSEVLPGAFTPAETTLVTTNNSSEWAGANSAKRRWVVRSDQIHLDGIFRVRTAYSDTVGSWHELPEIGYDDAMCAIAPLSETSAMVVYAGASGLAWRRLDGEQWTEGGVLDSRPWVGTHPRFSPRPSGGYWLFWTERSQVHVSSYRDGQWERGDSLVAIHPPGTTFWAAWGEVTRDSSERPLLAWGDLGYGYTYYDILCLSFPTEAGWAPGDEVPGSIGAYDPTVARDRNGDGWVGWWKDGHVYTNHTYVSATTSVPSLATFKDDVTVSWTLSEPAPDSYWAVLRAEWNGEYKQVARVRAGPSTQMSCVDQGVPHEGILRYRIRRESVDKRYEWLSPEMIWGSPLAVFGLIVNGPQPVLDLARMELIGAAAGPVSIQLYDIQGRRVQTHRMIADGSGRDTVRFHLAAQSDLHSGVYFVRAVDARGRVTAAVRLVVLR